MSDIVVLVLMFAAVSFTGFMVGELSIGKILDIYDSYKSKCKNLESGVIK